MDNLVVGDLAGSSLPEPVTIRTSDTVICEGGYVRFEDQTSGYPTSWNWTFESGTPATSTGQNPVVQYTASGEYDVSLTASNAVGESTRIFDTLLPSVQCPQMSVLCLIKRLIVQGTKLH